jgi:membrane fusion protein, multidrug efflux system
MPKRLSKPMPSRWLSPGFFPTRLIRFRKKLLLVPTAAALISVLAACSKPVTAPEPVRAVRTMTITPDSAGASYEFAAEVRARTETRLSFRVGGKLLSRSAEVGQRVRAGQVLAQIDGTDLKLGQQAAQAATQAAQSAYDVAAADLKRFKDLREQGFISGAEFDRRDATFQASRAQLDQAKAQAAVQGNQAGYAALSAAGAGVVVGVDAEVGAVLAAGAPVLRLALDGPRDAVFAVPEDAVAGVRQLQGRAGALKIKAWGSNSTTTATVREVAAAADPATRTFLIKADLGATPVQLGQTLTVVIEQARRDGVTRLPLAAVMQQQGRSAVWVLDRSTMTVRVQAVTVAGADGNTVIVADGLSPGQTVVTAGVHALSPGQKVKLYEAASPTAAVPVSTAVTTPAAAPQAAAVAPAVPASAAASR